MLFPSSHCSPGSTTPSPQNGRRQLRQGELASSHSSPGSIVPFPHQDFQSLSQPSPFTWLPSSHSSPGWTMPSPQVPAQSGSGGSQARMQWPSFPQSGWQSGSMGEHDGSQTPSGTQRSISGLTQSGSIGATQASAQTP